MDLFKFAENFDIGTNKIGKGAPCYIIAEAGSNHNRDLEIAFQLIDAAAEAGANAVKFQTFSADTIASKVESEITRIDFAGAKSLHELYKKAELPREWLRELFEYARDKQIVFLSTPFDEQAVEELDAIGVGAFKIASFEINHFPLLTKVAQTGKPVLLSTGAATLCDIEEALQVLTAAGCHQIALFHCGLGYPMDPAQVNLKAMETLHHAFRCPVGYSDHTTGITVPIAVAARGGRLVEKHFTLSRGLDGPDHAFALEPKELLQMVTEIRLVERALGSSIKGPSISETEHKKRGYRSLFARVDIKRGQTITKDMLAVLRPGVGLHPRYLDVIDGMRAARDIGQFEPVSWESLLAK